MKIKRNNIVNVEIKRFAKNIPTISTIKEIYKIIFTYQVVQKM